MYFYIVVVVAAIIIIIIAVSIQSVRTERTHLFFICQMDNDLSLSDLFWWCAVGSCYVRPHRWPWKMFLRLFGGRPVLRRLNGLAGRPLGCRFGIINYERSVRMEYVNEACAEAGLHFRKMACGGPYRSALPTPVLPGFFLLTVSKN